LAKKWVVQDRYGGAIYLTDERWNHIIDPYHHPEMEGYLDHLRETIRTGKRQQEHLDPHKYRYFKEFDDLVGDNNYIVAIVKFKLEVDEKGNAIENNFVVTAYQKYMKLRR